MRVNVCGRANRKRDVDGDLAELIKRGASDRRGDSCRRFEPRLIQGFLTTFGF